MALGTGSITRVLQQRQLGLFIIRLAVGIIMIVAGWSKFSAGSDVLNKVGANVSYVGLNIGTDNAFTLFFGIMAAGTELIGGAFLVLGIFFRLSSFMLMGTMVVATAMKFQVSGGDFREFGYPMLAGLVLLGLLFTGSGRIGVQKDD
jgi:putative oxidoreductase